MNYMKDGCEKDLCEHCAREFPVSQLEKEKFNPGRTCVECKHRLLIATE